MQVQPNDEQRIVAAIEAAELVTSGEVRVHLNDTCSGDPLRDAQKQFQKLGMHRTAERNGILFFLALESHKFAVVGDSGIHAKVGQSFWEGIRDQMVPELKEGRWIEALELGIAEAGRALAEHFPHQGSSDRDELSNEVSRG
ncbi:MAG: TPM domain-containing protein [Schleiferiaceae bacterium]